MEGRSRKMRWEVKGTGQQGEGSESCGLPAEGRDEWGQQRS